MSNLEELGFKVVKEKEVKTTYFHLCSDSKVSSLAKLHSGFGV